VAYTFICVSSLQALRNIIIKKNPSFYYVATALFGASKMRQAYHLNSQKENRAESRTGRTMKSQGMKERAETQNLPLVWELL
jgi:hypothetical protein